MELSPGWSVATYEVEGKGKTFAYKRYTGRDRLDWLKWQQRIIEQLADGVDILDTTAWAVEEECAAMAGRLVTWPDGHPVTPQQLEEWNGTDTDLWTWLSRLLYAPAYEDLASGGSQAKKNCALLLTVHQEIHRLLLGIAENASVTPTKPGTLTTGEEVGQFVPMDVESGQAAVAAKSASQT